jgi:hypothetical protein
MTSPMIFGIIGGILLLIIVFLYYKIYHSCKDKQYFNLSNFSCTNCKVCPNGNFALKDSCSGMSNTNCKKWNWCKKNEKIIEYANQNQDFKCQSLGECANINCIDGEEFIMGWESCKDLGDNQAFCQKCKECKEDEVDIKHCKNRTKNQVPYEITRNENNETIPLSCIGINDRICEPKSAIRLKNKINIFFNNNKCLTVKPPDFDYIQTKPISGSNVYYSPICIGEISPISLQNYNPDEDGLNTWKFDSYQTELFKECSLLENDIIRLYRDNEDGSRIHLASCFTPPKGYKTEKPLVTIGIAITDDGDFSRIPNNYISDLFKVVNVNYDSHLITKRLGNNDINYFRLMPLSRRGENFKLYKNNTLDKDPDIPDMEFIEYKYYLGFNTINSDSIPVAFEDSIFKSKTNETKIQLLKPDE